MTVDPAFPPDPARATLLSHRMHVSLAASLRHVRERCEGEIAFDGAAIDALIAALEDGSRYPPVTFSYYYELVPALLDGAWHTAARMFAALASAAPVVPGLRVVALGEAGLGAASDRYRRLMNGDSRLQLGLQPPPADSAAAFRRRLARAFDLLDHALPALAGEIRGLVNEVVIVAGDPTQSLQFDGGSHFQLWGALFLNGDFHHTDQALIEVLAHESAHSLLFGFCTETALVENTDDELFVSPLRPDPRPMDGIYHATFVSARMHWAMSRLLASRLLDEAGEEAARAALAGDIRNFDAGYGVVAEFGRLTPLGAALIGEAKSYMDAATRR